MRSGHRQYAIATVAGFAGGLGLGLIVWSQQTHRSRRDLFSRSVWRRLAALGYLRGQPSDRTVLLLRDYVNWEKRPGLRLRGQKILRQMERVIH